MRGSPDRIQRTRLDGSGSDGRINLNAFHIRGVRRMTKAYMVVKTLSKAKNLFGFNNSFTRWPSNGLCWSDPLLNSPPNQGERCTASRLRRSSVDRGGLLAQAILV
jgi:hypothetical protein